RTAVRHRRGAQGDCRTRLVAFRFTRFERSFRMLIRYYCHLGLLSGYGVAAEKLGMTLFAGGHTLEIRPLMPYEQVVVNPDLPLARMIRRDHELDPNPDLVIVHTLPMDCATVLAKVEEAQGLLPERTKLVAYTTWEGASAIPMAMAQSLHVD